MRFISSLLVIVGLLIGCTNKISVPEGDERLGRPTDEDSPAPWATLNPKGFLLSVAGGQGELVSDNPDNPGLVCKESCAGQGLVVNAITATESQIFEAFETGILSGTHRKDLAPNADGTFPNTTLPFILGEVIVLAIGTQTERSQVPLTKQRYAAGEFIFVVPGDANGDGAANGLDYLIWAGNFDKPSSNGFADGDFNLDGQVDTADYDLWAAGFGVSYESLDLRVIPPSDWSTP